MSFSPAPFLSLLLALTAVWQLASSAARAQTLLLDFGNTATTVGAAPNDPARTWNNVTTTIGSSNTGQLLNLVTTANVATAIDLAMVSRFNSTNTNGANNSTLFPANATTDNLYGNTEVFGTLTNVFPSFKFAQLDPGLLYSFLFYGSRTATDNREAAYTVAGAAPPSTVYLNAASNVDNTVSVNNVAPTAAGEITISIAPGPNNNNANHFTYLNVMQVTVVPEPTSAALLLGSAAFLGLARWRRRS